jgi:arylsulfatase A-like enzyme
MIFLKIINFFYMKKRIIFSLLFYGLFLFLGSSCQNYVSEDSPNILIIVSDDQGYSDIGFQGKRLISTPYLNKLAESGVICTNGYVTCPFCSPSRAGLLTGRVQQRFGHEFNPVYDPLDEKEGLPISERLLPEFFKDAGYKTGWIGKWHLGSSKVHLPQNRGFDETFGFIGGGHNYYNWTPGEKQYNLPIKRNGDPVEVTKHLTTAFGDEAANFIHKNQKQPWFLYLAFNAPHAPHQPREEYEKRFSEIDNERRRKYLAQINMLDDAIGNVINALKESEQLQNTLVFYFTDNGGSLLHGANNWPLRGGKGELYEGGIRVPFIVSWPKILTAGTVYDMPLSTLDIFATSLSQAGIKQPDDKKYDGVNIIPYIIGEKADSPHQQLFWRRHAGEALAVRSGNWKLIRKRGHAPELYDLDEDISETNNLYEQKSDLAEKLVKELDAWNDELMMPVFSGSYVKVEDWGPGGANVKNSKRNPYLIK